MAKNPDTPKKPQNPEIQSPPSRGRSRSGRRWRNCSIPRSIAVKAAWDRAPACSLRRIIPGTAAPAARPPRIARGNRRRRDFEGDASLLPSPSRRRGRGWGEPQVQRPQLTPLPGPPPHPPSPEGGLRRTRGGREQKAPASKKRRKPITALRQPSRRSIRNWQGNSASPPRRKTPPRWRGRRATRWKRSASPRPRTRWMR